MKTIRYHNDDEDDNRKTMVTNFLANVKSNMPLWKLVQKINSCKLPEEKISLIKPFFKWIPSSPEHEQRFMKNAQISVDYIERFLFAMEGQVLKDAIQHLNMAFAYASKPKNLGFMYICRSKLLAVLNEEHGAVRSINCAITSPLPSTKPVKKPIQEMFKLKKKYEKDIELLSEDENLLNAIITEKKNRRSIYTNLFTLKSQNPTAPALRDFVEIKFNKIRGRHLIVTKDVPIGTCLLVEKPFVAVLAGTLDLKIEHCHHCFKKNSECLPCPRCVFAMFCDTTCMKEAATYHHYECACLPELKSILKAQSTYHDNFYLAFKLICMVGPKKLFQRFLNNLNGNNSCGNSEENILSSEHIMGVYSSSSYSTIFNLYADVTDQEDSFYFPVISLMLTNLLDTKTNFFKNIDLDFKSRFQDYVAQILLTHFQCFQKNSFVVREMDRVDGVTLSSFMKNPEKNFVKCSFTPFAKAIYPTASLINHSCSPNVQIFTGLKYGISSFVSMKPLKPGEELVFSYCPPFSIEEREVRQEKLMKGYNFTCECVACRNNWSVSNKIITFCCSKCCVKLRHELKTRENMSQFVLDEVNRFQCFVCKSQYCQERLQEEFSSHEARSNKCIQLVDNNSPLQAIEELKQCLTYFENNIIPPSINQILVENKLRKAIHLTIHFSR